jgi:hypothetical protein
MATLLPGNWLFLVLILGIVAFGIGTAYTRTGAAGMAPLFVMLGYNLSNSLSLTSGARYLVPMDFAVILYFCIGVVELTLIAALILQGKKVYSLWKRKRNERPRFYQRTKIFPAVICTANRSSFPQHRIGTGRPGKHISPNLHMQKCLSRAFQL